MKKVLSFVLSALTVFGTFVSCSSVPQSVNSISVTSSDAEKYAAWLDERLETVPSGITLGIGSDENYDVDMTGFSDDGYIIRSVGDETIAFGKTTDGLDRAVRAYAKAVEAGRTGGFDVVYGEGYRVKRLTIAGRDISEYSIYMDCADDECHNLAASELRDFIGKACGFYPEITDEPTEHMIVLEQVLPEDERYEVLGDEGFTIEVKDGGDLYISGGQWRGCLFGVSEFLEKYVGWRFLYDFYYMESYTSDYSKGCIDYLYGSEHVDVPAGTRDTQTPAVGSRRMIKTVTDNGVYGYRQKDNYHLATDASVQKKFNAYGIRHIASHGIMDGPYKDFVDWEPNAYSQPCFTNEENIEISIEYYTNYVNEKLAEGAVVGKDFLEVDVAQLDSLHFCTCQDCQEYIALDGGYIGPVLYFTNRIAEEIAKIEPELHVQMLAYMGTTSVPKVTRPLDNVSVSYCFYVDATRYFCNNHPLDGSKCTGTTDGSYRINNYEAAAEIRGWSEICDNLTVWYYPGNWRFTALTSPLLENTYYDMQFLLSIENVDCIFTCPAGYNNIMGYFRSEEMFVPYMLAKLAWGGDNISYDEYLAMVKEYFYIICGDGAEEIMEYLFLLEKCTADGCFTTMSYGKDNDFDHRMNYTKFGDHFDFMIELYESAMKKADTEWQENYIENMTLTMYFTGLAATHDSWYLNGDAESRAKYEKYYEHFKTIALKHDFYMNGFMETKTVLTEDDFNIEENIKYLVKLSSTDM